MESKSKKKAMKNEKKVVVSQTIEMESDQSEALDSGNFSKQLRNQMKAKNKKNKKNDNENKNGNKNKSGNKNSKSKNKKKANPYDIKAEREKFQKNLALEQARNKQHLQSAESSEYLNNNNNKSSKNNKNKTREKKNIAPKIITRKNDKIKEQ